MLMGVSGLIWGSFGLFLVALQREFGWSRGEISGVFATFALANALSAPAIAAAMARTNSRHLLALLAILLGGALVLTAAWVGGLAAYWLIFGLAGGIGAQCVSSFVVFALLARRVRHRLATAMSIADAGSGLATLLGLPLLQFIIDVQGWRAAYALLAVLTLVVVVALHLVIFDAIRRSPRPLPAMERGTDFGTPSRAILWMCASYFCGSAAYHGLLTQQVALFDSQGIEPARAVWIVALSGGAVFAWRLISGWLCDVIGVSRVLAVAAAAVLVTFIGLSLLLSGWSVTGTALYPAGLAIGFGGQQVLLAVALRQFAAPARFAKNLAYGRLASGLGMAAGPVAGGIIYDVTASSPAVAFVLGGLGLGYVAGFTLATAEGKRENSLRSEEPAP
ncbi:MFS transporter [Aurantimonas endophytica]|nr:MFS transporter [Aurantimonas endophytica]